ncbi:MAG: outer membrane beta-barrel protein [Nitrospira sp.]|nr:outer membrane beta-barrel protein [Nitrospira sp.]
MKVLISSTVLLLCVLGYSESVRAQEEVRIRPVDGYLSGFGGYSFPLKTDFSFPGLTLRDVELDNNPSLGAKLGMWITAPRKTLGIDVGAEIDVTRFHPYASSGQVVSTNLGLAVFVATFDFHATYFGVNFLARYPMGVTPELPNGRWFPYIGVGGGALRLTFQLPGTNESQSTAPAFQGVGGVKVFFTKHFAGFVEGKFIHASNSIEVQGSGSGDLTINSVHGVCGLSFHFF